MNLKMTSKTGSLILICILFNFFVQAQVVDLNKLNQQEKIQNQITVAGSIVDSASDETLPFGSVMLVNNADKTDLMINSDSLGRFQFEDMNPGSYTFTAFYAGYPNLIKQIKIIGNESSHKLNLGAIKLSNGKTRLKDVKIVSFRDLIEQRPDGIVYNAEKDGSNMGTTADQLLQKVPMVTVDLDGNVQLRGSDNVKVLIDGKPSSIIAANVKDALQQIPSDNIKSVEVITNPGAKYDAEGSAGIINIITKRSIIKGISGMVYGSPSYKIDQDLFNVHTGGSINYRNNKFGLSANLGGGSWSNLSETNSIRAGLNSNNNEDALNQTSTNSMRGQYYYGGISSDYEIDSLNSIQAGFRVNPGRRKSEIDQRTQILSDTIDYNRNTTMNNPSMSYSFNGGYNKKFKNHPKRTLDFLALYSIDHSNGDYDLTQENNRLNLINAKEQNKNNTSNKEFTSQIDYAQPFTKHNQKLELGLKYINRNIGSNYSLFNSDGSSDFVLDPNQTNVLDYTQQVAAGYAQFTTALAKDLNAIVGLRNEYTNIQGDLKENGGTFTNHFNNLLPSAILSYNLKNFNKLKLAYDQRIERPSIAFVNPYTNNSDPFNLSQGNPQLKPELTHSLELGYSTMFGNNTINLSTFWHRTNNAIESSTIVGTDGIARTTFGNDGDKTTWGANLFGSTRLFNRWMININGNLYYQDLNSPSLNLKNNGFEYDGNIYSTVTISDRFSVEGFGMYRGRTVSLQGSKTGYYYYRLGLKANILKGKGTLTLGAENFLNPSEKVTSNYTYQNTNYQTVSYWHGRGIRLAFSYRFGKMKFSAPKKSINNDDLKGGNSDQPGNGGQQM